MRLLLAPHRNSCCAEPNLYAHFSKLRNTSTIAAYTRLYDGVTSVLHRDHPTLQFAAMCWGGIPVQEVKYFMDKANHDDEAPWPPAFLTFHIYEGPTSDHNSQAGFKIGLSGSVVQQVQQVVQFVNASSGGKTRSYVDEMGVFGCPAMPPAQWNASSVLDSEPGRFAFHNPRAAWFAAVCKIVILSRFACCPSR